MTACRRAAAAVGALVASLGALGACGSVSGADARRLDTIVAAEPLHGVPGLVELERRERAAGGADDVWDHASNQRANTVSVTYRGSGGTDLRSTVRTALDRRGWTLRSETCPVPGTVRTVASRQLDGYEAIAAVDVVGDQVAETVTAPPDPAPEWGQTTEGGSHC